MFEDRFSSQNGIVHEEYTTEEQRFVVRFTVEKSLNAKDIHKEMFPVYDGKRISRETVTPW
jgi:hypothetical protein